jgi:predicted O-linked N-acetylglucosamine transferase (SPINDLY family)
MLQTQGAGSASAQLLTQIAELRAQLARGDAVAAETLAVACTAGAPDSAEAWHLGGLAALQRGDSAAAIERLERATVLAPADAAAWNNLGTARLRGGRLAAAVEALQTAVKLAPMQLSAAVNLGTALQAVGDIDRAVIAVERALSLAPEAAEVWNNLGNLYKEQGRLSDALRAYDTALERSPLLREAFSNKLAALKLSVEHDPAAMLAAHREFARRFEAEVLKNYTPNERDASPDRRLRIGYVSPDCHGAVPAFIRPVLRAHDAAQFEVFCYYNNVQPPEKDAAIAGRVTRRIMAGLTDAQVAAQIRTDAIDVLIDIAGHTGRNRLGVFVLRPAPIQVTWLDYLGTTGLDSIDYRLTDAIADPAGAADAAHSECLLRLPDAQWCYEPAADAPPVAPLPALRNGWITFGSFNNYSKLTDATLALWAQLLADLPDARLLVVGAAEGRAQERVRSAFAATGAADRVRFLPRINAAEYRAAFAEVDVALDPFPFSGATTTLDALWQGVPVLTLPGATSASRSSASILAVAGLSEFVATNAQAYAAIARTMATQLPRLAELRAGLRDRIGNSALTDAPRFVRHLESALRSMWHAWCAATPAPFTRATAAASAGAALPASKWRRADLAYGEARRLMEAGNLDEAIPRLQSLLRVHQNWSLAQRDYASAVLAWARAHPQAIANALPPCPVIERAPFVSIIMCSVDENKLARATASYRARFGDFAHEIIAIRDAKSLCEGYNRAAAQARGDILVFSHDDIELVTPDFANRLLGHLAQWDAVGVAGTSRVVSGNWAHAGQPYVHGHVLHQPPDTQGYLLLAAGCNAPVMSGMEALDGVFIAVRRAVWDALRFDERVFNGFHLYDLDFTYRAARAGHRLAVALDLTLIHQSGGAYSQDWFRYARAFEAKFSGMLAHYPDVVLGSFNCKLQSLQQAQLLLAGLAHFRFGS